MLNHEQKPNQKSVSIIGCGWLGKALAKSLIADHYHVLGTTQQQDKLVELTALGIKAELLSLPIDISHVKEKEIFLSSSLIICIPPQIRQGKTDYADKVSQIVTAAEQGSVEKIILISTTAVYSDLLGNIDESSCLNESSAKVTLLAEAEKRALSFNKQSIVLRAAGLVGKHRHPGSFLRHKRMLTAPNAWVNLIHQQDVIGVITELLSRSDITGVYNLASKMKMNKRALYSIAAKALKLEEPIFDKQELDQAGVHKNSANELGKLIISDKIRQSLVYQFQYDNLVDWIEQS
jgi:nucleoside-diphosphate-sugar epimerase